MAKGVFVKAAGAAVGLALGASAAAADLVEFTIDTDKYTIEKPLTGQPGDAVNGKQVAIDRRKGNCLACHQMPVPEQPFHGAIAPPLMGVGARYTPAQLRLRLVDAQIAATHGVGNIHAANRRCRERLQARSAGGSGARQATRRSVP